MFTYKYLFYLILILLYINQSISLQYNLCILHNTVIKHDFILHCWKLQFNTWLAYNVLTKLGTRYILLCYYCYIDEMSDIVFTDE